MNIDGYKKQALSLRESDIYSVYDLRFGDMSLSLTELHAHKHTAGHSHKEVNEVYMCKSGLGIIIIGEMQLKMAKDEVFVIPAGQFHQVINTENQDLVFWSVFNRYEGR